MTSGPTPGTSLEAFEWLSDTAVEAADGGPADGEPEIFPLLAAIIPAIISAAPAIISSVASAFSKKPAAAPPPPAPVPPVYRAPAPSPPSATAPTRPSAPAAPATPRPPQHLPQPQPQPAPGTGADLTTQLTSLLPSLVALIAGIAGQNQNGPAVEAQEPLCAECGPQPSWPDATDDPSESAEASEFSTLVALPARATINVGVSPCPTSLLVATFGSPRAELTDECQATTSAFWRDRFVTESVGPFRVRGHRKAIEVFRDAFASLRTASPDLYNRIGSMGMLCVRHVRGRPGVLSNHGLGMALDITIDGQLDVRGDDMVQRGLIAVHETFTRFGIYWGAGFRTEDAMHFEVGADLIAKWIQEGSI
jgi:D-alanyl-D-alanine carboxypeptidase